MHTFPESLVIAHRGASKDAPENTLTAFSLAWEQGADAIIVTAGSPDIPQPLVDQLAMGGRLVIPVGDESVQDLIRLTKTEEGVKREDLGGCRFVKLIGKHGWNEE